MSRHWIAIERAANGGFLITGPEHEFKAAVSTCEEMIDLVREAFVEPTVPPFGEPSAEVSLAHLEFMKSRSKAA